MKKWCRIQEDHMNSPSWLKEYNQVDAIVELERQIKVDVIDYLEDMNTSVNVFFKGFQSEGQNYRCNLSAGKPYEISFYKVYSDNKTNSVSICGRMLFGGPEYEDMQNKSSTSCNYVYDFDFCRTVYMDTTKIPQLLLILENFLREEYKANNITFQYDKLTFVITSKDTVRGEIGISDDRLQLKLSLIEGNYPFVTMRGVTQVLEGTFREMVNKMLDEYKEKVKNFFTLSSEYYNTFEDDISRYIKSDLESEDNLKYDIIDFNSILKEVD